MTTTDAVSVEAFDPTKLPITTRSGQAVSNYHVEVNRHCTALGGLVDGTELVWAINGRYFPNRPSEMDLINAEGPTDPNWQIVLPITLPPTPAGDMGGDDGDVRLAAACGAFVISRDIDNKDDPVIFTHMRAALAAADKAAFRLAREGARREPVANPAASGEVRDFGDALDPNASWNRRPHTTPSTSAEEALCRTLMRAEGREARADQTGDLYDCGLDKSLPAWRAKLWMARYILAAHAGLAARTAEREAVLAEACKPWSFHMGERPDDDSPLSGVFGAGMAYAEKLLADVLGVRMYEGGDGSEDFDCDATTTLTNILAEAGAWDKYEGRLRTLPSAASPDGAGSGGEPVVYEPLRFTYRNYRGEVAERTVRPISVRYGMTEWHPKPGWLLRAYDCDKSVEREFAMADIVAPPASVDAVMVVIAMRDAWAREYSESADEWFGTCRVAADKILAALRAARQEAAVRS